MWACWWAGEQADGRAVVGRSRGWVCERLGAWLGVCVTESLCCWVAVNLCMGGGAARCVGLVCGQVCGRAGGLTKVLACRVDGLVGGWSVGCVGGCVGLLVGVY